MTCEDWLITLVEMKTTLTSMKKELELIEERLDSFILSVKRVGGMK